MDTGYDITRLAYVPADLPVELRVGYVDIGHGPDGHLAVPASLRCVYQ
ncbi:MULTISPECIES: hypothetical protein [Streptomyces]